LETLITKSFKRLLDKGTHRGFVTYEELAKSLGKRHYSQENIEKAFLYIFDNKVCLVEKKSNYRSVKKKDAGSADSDKSADTEKSDDPIRMYLREMGGVELLSREGEIAIAKRIEAGKNVMINGLSESPLTAQKVFEWKENLEKAVELVSGDAIIIDHLGDALFYSGRKIEARFQWKRALEFEPQEDLILQLNNKIKGLSIPKPGVKAPSSKNM